MEKRKKMKERRKMKNRKKTENDWVLAASWVMRGVGLLETDCVLTRRNVPGGLTFC